MGEKGDEIQLLGFLNAVLGRTGENEFTSVEILENKSLSAEYLGSKASILDVRAVLPDGSKVNIEVQLRNRSNFDRRSLFYWGKEYTKGIKSGQDYLELPTVININIIDFEFMETENFHTVFHLREEKESHLILTDILEIHFINMIKWRKHSRIDIVNEALHRWLAWLDKNSPPELIEEVINMDKTIMAANDRQVYVTGDEEAIHAYEMREMALMDLTSDLNQARREGKKEGTQEERIRTASKLMKLGVSIEIISQATGLSIEEIKKI